MPSRWTHYNASHTAARKISRNQHQELAVRRFLTHWRNGVFENVVMDIIVPSFPAGRVPVGPGETPNALVTLFDPAVRRLRRAVFVRTARVRIGTQCAICSAEDGTLICTPMHFVFQGHLI